VNVELRALADGDVPAVVAFYNEVSQALHGENATSEAELRTFLTTPGVEPARDVRLAYRDGDLVGYTDVFDENKWHTRFWGDLHVHPERGGEAVGHALVDWCERRSREDAKAGAWFRYYVAEEARILAAVLEERGFRRVRSSFRMMLDLADEPPQPEWPEGIGVRPIRDGEERALYEADQECFSDHWEHVEEPFDQWLHWTVDREGYDRSLALVAVEGDEIAGYSICQPHEGEPDLGWVEKLGVRRRWRKRGLGLALLRHSFREFRARGFPRAGLGVDAENLTGAVRLYERAGMHVARRYDCYELPLA
jgi:mycothiol synthase